ncbi:unnamed protein product (macronuclear) [Paramecium tetraurelia]|uniref:PA14 domain-containing protein n=1 Tax=Paramecium tetraurelia TaxID=5888 RepID=A0E164_PARTE|nr:uncharacterized protein GSPATT00022200001 [Paramecium tetraurelia]CAK89031.1 unnamed protein product [Paramecium tetraurelia]|eukprot:XP_001456428.1 hypothetical protein (macronuclear) [Paramecium tetraurelia strain d4-2]
MVSSSFLQYLFACICVEQLRALTLVPEQNQKTETINLFWVSTSQFKETSNLYGSTQGGTSLYMKAIGFDSIVTNHIVYIGKYPCIIDETYAKEQEVSCKTTAPLLNDNSLQNLLVSIETSDNKKSVCTSQTNKCLFSYKQEISPYLHYLIPSIGFANSVLTTKGQWVLQGEEQNEIEKILIGQKYCVKNQYRILNTQMQKGEDVISCKLAEDLISSTYQVNLSTRRGNILSQKSFKMLPIISSLQWSNEANDSFILLIKGQGFKSGLTDNIVKISGTDVSITVLEASINQLKVQIPKITDQILLDSLNVVGSVFISGTGLLHTKYDLRGLTNKYTNCDVFRNDIISDSQELKARIIQHGIQSQPDSIDEVESQYGQYFRGFLKATQSGEYQFLLAADDCATFYIQTAETLKPIRAESPAASCQQSTQYRNYWGEQLWDSSKAVNSISQTVNLVENQYYYIEIFHVNTVGKGFVTLSMNAKITEVQAPNTKQSQLFQVKTSYTPKSEIISIDIYNSQGNVLLLDTFKLKFTNSNQLSYTTEDITLNYNSAQIQQSLLDCCNYLTQVKINKLDNSGLILDDASETYAGNQYIITFLSHRGEDRSLPQLITTQEQFSFNAQTTQEPLDPISGTFKLSITVKAQVQIFVDENNNQGLSYDVDPSVLADNFQRLIGERPIVWTEGRPKDGQIWNILFSSCANTIQNFQSSWNNLQSGNGIVNLVVKNIKSCNSQLYEPIPTLKLFTYGTKPQVQVSTSEGQGACLYEGACDFNFQQTNLFVLQSYGVSNEIMSLSFTIQSDAQFTLAATDFTIEFRGAICGDIKIQTNDGDLFKLLCTLETQNAQVVAEAGTNQYPIVLNKLYGYIRRDPSVIAALTSLEFNSINPSSASPDGGAEITLLGLGFPKDFSRKFVLKMGTTQITPLTVSNQKIVFMHPAGTDGTIKIEFNGNSYSDSSFTYNLAYKLTITKLSSILISPFFRDTLQVTGTNFGTVLQDVKAFIQNKEIQVIDVQDKLLTVQVNVTLEIAKTQLLVQRKQYGQTSSAITVDISITHLTPNSSTIKIKSFGGYQVKVLGSNFLNGPSIISFNSVNPQICDITYRNDTNLSCMSPPQILDVQSGVFRLIQNFKHVTTCLACKFEYQLAPDFIKVTILDNTINYLKYKPKYLMLWSEEAKQQNSNPLLFYKQSQYIDALQSYDIVWDQKILEFTPGQAVQMLFQLSATASDLMTKLAAIKLSFSQNGQTKFSLITQAANQVTIVIVPQLTQGLHLTQPVLSYSSTFLYWYTRFGLGITSISDTSSGGGVILIKGWGFNEIYIKDILVQDKECTEIKVINSTDIQCNFKARLTAGQYMLTLNQIDQENQDKVLTRNMAINIKDYALSPKVTSIQIDSEDKLDATRNAIIHISGTFQLKIQGENLAGTDVSVRLIGETEIQTGKKNSGTSTILELEFSNVPIGTYQIEIRVDSYYGTFSDGNYENLILDQSQAPTVNNPSFSTIGGVIINISGVGFSSNSFSHLVKFCGLTCKVLSSSFNSLEVLAPMLLPSQLLQSTPYSKILLKDLIISGDKMELAQNIYDDIISTEYSSDSQTSCFIQFNLKSQYAQLKLTKLRFQPKLEFDQNKLRTIKIYYTIDGQNWISLEQLKYINEGWNIVILQTPIDKINAIKFIDDQGVQGSQCSFSEIELYGWIYYDDDILTTCQLDINVNGIQLPSLSNANTFPYQHQPIVESVVPKYGPVNVETVITIKGSGFIPDQTIVTIDNVQCLILSVITTQITCKTGIKTVFTDNSGLVVYVSKAQALVIQQFMYIQKWSDASTWEYKVPKDEDSVLIKNYQKVLLDVNTKQLERLIIEGTLIFADEQDTKLIANSIILREGSLIIGSQDQPYQHQAIIMISGRETDFQFPLIGNKVIGCIKCQIQMFGKQRTFTWSFLDSKVLKGDSIIKLSSSVDWNVGESIVIATSSNNIEENEIRIIKAVSSDKKSITLDKPLSYTHTSELTSKTEVGLLSRNILIQTESQGSNNYGVHIHINGRQSEGTIVKISNVEIANGGQTNLVGRYPIHFFNNEEMDQSLIEGNSIHDSYSRCIVLNNVKYLRVINNVCFNIIGNAIHLTSVADIHNRIESNLVISIKSNQYVDNSCSFFNFQTYINQLQDIDRQSSAFYISNPQNTIINNRAISSDYIGFNIFVNRINSHDHLMTQPLGWDVKNIQNNVAHSVVGHGIQINILLDTQQQQDQQNLAYILKLFSVWQNIFNDLNLIIRTETEVFETQFNFPNADAIDLSIISSSTLTNLQNPLIIKIQYLLSNQNFQVYRFRDQAFQPLLEIPNQQNCQFGDWYNDQITKSLYICISGQQQKSKYPIKVKGMICLNNDQCNFANENAQCPNILLIQNNDDGSSGGQDSNNTENNNNNNGGDSNTDNTTGNENNNGGTDNGNTDNNTNTGNTDNTNNNGNTNNSGNTENTNTDNSNTNNNNGNTDNTNTDNSNTNNNNTDNSNNNNTGNTDNTNNNNTGNTDNTNNNNTGNTNNTDNNNTGNTNNSDNNNTDNTNNNNTDNTNTGNNNNDNTNTGNNDNQVNTIYNWSSPLAWKPNQIPKVGDKVTIKKGYQIILDIDPPELDELTIEGQLIFDKKRQESVLQSSSIIISQGQIIAGSKENPFEGKITIKSLNIQVFNRFELYSTIPQTFQTRLVVSSQAGSNNIEVQECQDWQIGDKIALGPSGTRWNYNEEKVIINKQGCVLTLNSPLRYDYYGDRSITIMKNNIGQLDMRTLVVHLSRKIKIQNPDLSQGGTIQIVHGLIENDIYIGQISLQGVELVNFGQIEKAGLTIENIFIQASQTSSIVGCSFHEGQGKFLRISNSNKVSVLNNVFYSGVKALVEIVDQKYLIFKNNILIHVKKAVTSNWAVLANFIFSKSNLNILRSNLEITENIGQGSEDAGFYIVSTYCNQVDQANIYNNVCSSAQNACFAVVQRNSACDAISDLYAYHSKIGIMFSVNSRQLEMKKFITAENKINIILKGSSINEMNNVIKISDGYITAVARPNCFSCYENIDVNYCSSTLGMQLATMSSQSFVPTVDNLMSDQFDWISTKQVMDLKVLVNNLEFNQFKVNNNQVANCVENAVFRQHPQAIDMTGRHYLKNTLCTDCEFESLLYRLRDSDFNKIGFLGGCGSMECTGQKNILIEDLTGDFFGEIGQGISNNTEFGQHAKYCKRIEQWNGYWCPGRNIQVLYFMSTAPDENTRLFSPVVLSDGKNKNILNSCYEWNWLQSKPLQTRESNFIGLVSANSIIGLNTTGLQPTSSKFWLSQNSDAKAQDQVIISIKFDIKLMPKLFKNGITISPSLLDSCGSYNYSFIKNKLDFTLTQEPDCYVDVKLFNYLAIKQKFLANQSLNCIQFELTMQLYFQIDSQNTVCSNSIDEGRRRLGESDLVEITFEWAIIDDAQPGTPEAYGSEERLSKYIDKLSQFTPDPDFGIYEILSQSYESYILTEINFPSSEPTELLDTIISNPIVETNTNYSDTSSQGLDIISISENESVNQDKNNNGKVIISKDSEPFDDNDYNQEQSLIIILSIVIPLAFIILITIVCIRRVNQRKSQVVIPTIQIQQNETTNNKLPDTTLMGKSAFKTPKAGYNDKIEFVTKI